MVVVARNLRKTLGISTIFTVFLLCYGLATTTTFEQHRSDVADTSLPIKVVGGVESNTFLRKDFERRCPQARSYDDMRSFVKKLEDDLDLRKACYANIYEITCPCYDNTTLKTYNQSDDHPDV